MKIIINSILLIFLTALFLHSDELKIIESVPLETELGSVYTYEASGEWITSILMAKKTLDFEQFYFAYKKGHAIEKIVNAIKRKAKSGVKVRFIFDKKMLKETSKYLDILKSDNIQTEIIDISTYTGGVQHAKFFIVDDDRVIVGSHNFDWRSFEHIHEIGVVIISTVAADNFKIIYDTDWKLADGNYDIKKIKEFKLKRDIINRENKKTATLNGKEVKYYLAFSPESLTPHGFNNEVEEIIYAINNAKKYIKAQVMSYSDENFTEIYNAFKKASEKGVKINLIFSNWMLGKKKEKAIKKLSEIKNIKIKISSIPKHSKGFIPYARVEHCKYMVVDGKKALISTSNWGYDYFYSTRGAMVVIEGKEAGKVLESVFDKSWNSSYTFYYNPSNKYKSVKVN